MLTNFLWDKLFRKDVLQGIVFPTGRRFEDIAVSAQWLFNARKIVYIPAAKYHYTVRMDSLTNGLDEFDLQWRYDMVQALAAQNDFCVRHGMWEKASPKLFRTCMHLINRLALILSPDTVHKAMWNHCMSLIRRKGSVKGLGVAYRLKKYFVTRHWKAYSYGYRLYKNIRHKT